jgi:hypothetical protein
MQTAPPYYRLAILSAFAFTVLHAVALPMLMTYDGAQYVDLASKFGKRFPQEWDFSRTPLYPAMLRVCFWLLGRQPVAAIVPGTVLGFGAAWCVGATLRRLGHPRTAAAAVLVLAVHPILVTYEHVLLTEAGSVFFLALLINVLTWKAGQPAWHTGALVLAAIAAYCHRPTFLPMVSAVALLYGFELFQRFHREHPTARWSWVARAVAPHVAAVVLIPFLASLPWSMLSKSYPKHDYNREAILYGLLKQAVLPPSDPILAEARESYEHAIAEASRAGRMDVGGLTRGSHWPVFVSAMRYTDEAPAALRRSLRQYPDLLLMGFGRALLLNLGWPTFNSENDDYARGVITDVALGSKLYVPTPPWSPELIESFVQRTGHAALARGLDSLRPLFRALLYFGSVVTLMGFAFGLRRLNYSLLVLTALPLFWAVSHAATLISSDRLVLPAYVLFVANGVALPGLLLGSWRARRVAQAPMPGANRESELPQPAPEP